ncbi:protein rep [Streptosporangium sp. NPDC023825]|uniref:protein rep n=1 Tax=Streptosporangium sp. NPDC023825 TaxID=3154909 RepID=UPI00341917C7
MVKLAKQGPSFFSGVESCGRIWLCPVCSAKVRNRRGDEVAEGVGRWIGQGHDAHFFTATLPHDHGDALAASLGVLTDTWRWMTSHKAYKAAKRRFGVVGTIKAVEVTHGRNGWHPHIHAVVLVETAIETLSLFDWYARMDALWADGLVRHGWSPGRQPYRFRALPVQLGDSGRALAAYVTKVQDAGLGNELARADLKSSKKSSRTPFQILADFGTSGDVQDLDLWHEYESATQGKSAIRWSRGLRALVLPDVAELTDDEIAAEEQEGEDIAVILPHTWYRICDVPGAPTAVKEAIEQDGWEGLIRTLIAYRIGTEGVLRPEEWKGYELKTPDYEPER